eukprot:363877_1
MNNRRRTIETYEKWSIKKMCELLVPDPKADRVLFNNWKTFGKSHKPELVEFVYESHNNIIDAVPQTISIPPKFKSLSEENKQIKPRTANATKRRWINHIPQQLDQKVYNARRYFPSLPNQHTLRSNSKKSYNAIKQNIVISTPAFNQYVNNKKK